MITAEITIASSLPLPTEIRVCTLVLCDQVEVSLKNTLLLTRLTKNANLQRVDKFAYPGAKLRLLSLVHMHHGEKKFLLVVLKFTMKTILFH